MDLILDTQYRYSTTEVMLRTHSLHVFSTSNLLIRSFAYEHYCLAIWRTFFDHGEVSTFLYDHTKRWFDASWTAYRLFFLKSDCAIFFTNLHELYCQFISWKNSLNSGKFMDSCWISCQVMADMKKVYDDLIIINLYYTPLN